MPGSRRRTDAEPGRRRGDAARGGGAAGVCLDLLEQHRSVEAGLDAIGWYHEKRSDDDRNIGLGPDHDWSSHAADALGLLAVNYEAPYAPTPRNRYGYRRGSSGGRWIWESA
jgi:phage terminase large subunit